MSFILKKMYSSINASISQCFIVESNRGTFFVKKYHDGNKDRIQCEFNALNFLKQKSEFIIPQPINVLEVEHESYIIMEYYKGDKNLDADFWQSLGEKLALLHHNMDENFGFIEDNFIGLLKQSNGRHKNWNDFFIQERFLAQFKKAQENGFLKSYHNKQAVFTDFFQHIFPPQSPALIHGDLWLGNVISWQSKPVLIDPALYFGHPEAELSMTLLFSNFGENFYTAYQANYPLEKAWRERVKYYNLYPLLVHLNLFGESYLPEIIRTLDDILKHHNVNKP